MNTVNPAAVTVDFGDFIGWLGGVVVMALDL